MYKLNKHHIDLSIFQDFAALDEYHSFDPCVDAHCRALSNEAQRRCIVFPGQRSVIKCGAMGGDTNGKGPTPKKVARVAAVAAPAEPVMVRIRTQFS